MVSHSSQAFAARNSTKFRPLQDSPSYIVFKAIMAVIVMDTCRTRLIRLSNGETQRLALTFDVGLLWRRWGRVAGFAGAVDHHHLRLMVLTNFPMLGIWLLCAKSRDNSFFSDENLLIFYISEWRRSSVYGLGVRRSV